MKRVLKYEIPAPLYSTSFMSNVRVKKGAEFLSIGTQNERLYAWFIVDETLDQGDEERAFKIVGTGWNLVSDELDELAFIGTVQVPIEDSEMGSELVWHVWLKP